MRERVEPRGGTLRAGPRPDGGFEVEADDPRRTRVIRVFLVDDQALVRAGFRLVIDSQPDMTVVGEAGDGRDALEALGVTSADVVLMDVRMPELDGVAATARLVERDGDAAPRVVMLTTFDLDEYVFSASAPARAASCSRTPSRRSSSQRSARWRPATRSSRRARRGGSSSRSRTACRARRRTRAWRR